MSAYKDNVRGTWYASFKYVDIQGKRKTVTKRGFTTKREAIEYERDFTQNLTGSLDTTFEDFVNSHYLPYIKPRVKQSTLDTKLSILKKHIFPYFGDKKLRDIDNRLIIKWQNKILSEKNSSGITFADSYVKTIHLVLSSILNFAVHNYNLSKNAAASVGSMGSEHPREEMKFWTTEEYLKMSSEAMENPPYFYAFEVLYWLGLREGELLALTGNDFDLDAQTVKISKTYHRKNGEDIITSPKTMQSNRTVAIPKFLVEEIKDYIATIYDYDPSMRLFPLQKSSLTRMLHHYAKKAGVEEIRIHDLRHSHVSLLINSGYSALAIGKRIGHKSVDITYRYAHLFPHTQENIVNTLDNLKGEGDKDE